MINWFNMPSEGLSNGGQFEIKELTATENKTYEKDGEVYNKVTVNVEGGGSGGGGGSSDFSTVNLTLINSTANAYNVSLKGVFVINSEELTIETGFGDPDSETIVEAVLYKNMPVYATIDIGSDVLATCTGDVSIISSAAGGYTFRITGNGSIAIEDTGK